MHLRRWREYSEKVARAVKELVPNAKVYVIGGVAEGRPTVLSDIDILIVVPRGVEKHGLTRRILERAIEKHGLPWDAPVELHVVEEGEEGRYLQGKHIEILKSS
jgi:predicted nucleotidyltransferase